MYKARALIMSLFLLVIMAGIWGCAGQDDADRGINELPDPGPVDLETLAAKGVFIHSYWEEDGVLQISGEGINQRALEIISKAVGPDTPIRAYEVRAVTFIRGEIKEINPAPEAENILGTLYIEGEADRDVQTDAAYISVGPATRILKAEGDVQLALSFDYLEEGQKVEVIITGVVLESYPPQAGASIIGIF